jgi:hypothetical protein
MNGIESKTGLATETSAVSCRPGGLFRGLGDLGGSM